MEDGSGSFNLWCRENTVLQQMTYNGKSEEDYINMVETANLKQKHLHSSVVLSSEQI